MKVFNIKLIIILFFGLSLKLHAQVLKPDYAIIQHAGSIGYVSAGFGYELFKNKRGTLDFNYGYVPKSRGGVLNIASTKFSYRPLQIKINKIAKFYPVNPGAFLSYHFGKEFDISFDKDQYKKGYYPWSTAIRGHLSLSNEVKIHAGNKLKSISLYSEFNASDLYLASMLFKNNRQWLTPSDVIKLGIGVRAGF